MSTELRPNKRKFAKIQDDKNVATAITKTSDLVLDDVSLVFNFITKKHTFKAGNWISIKHAYKFRFKIKTTNFINWINNRINESIKLKHVMFSNPITITIPPSYILNIVNDLYICFAFQQRKYMPFNDFEEEFKKLFHKDEEQAVLQVFYTVIKNTKFINLSRKIPDVTAKNKFFYEHHVYKKQYQYVEIFISKPSNNTNTKQHQLQNRIQQILALNKNVNVDKELMQGTIKGVSKWSTKRYNDKSTEFSIKKTKLVEDEKEFLNDRNTSEALKQQAINQVCQAPRPKYIALRQEMYTALKTACNNLDEKNDAFNSLQTNEEKKQEDIRVRKIGLAADEANYMIKQTPIHSSLLNIIGKDIEKRKIFVCCQSGPFATGGFGEVFNGLEIFVGEQNDKLWFTIKPSDVILKRQKNEEDDVSAQQTVKEFIMHKELEGTDGISKLAHDELIWFCGRHKVIPVLVLQPLNGFATVAHYCDKGVRMSSSESNNFMIQLLDTLDHLYVRGVLHNDLSAMNCLWNQPKLKLVIIDFGAAEKLCPGKDYVEVANPTGSPGYAAPETQSGQLFMRSDMFSAGHVGINFRWGKQLVVNMMGMKEQDYNETLRRFEYGYKDDEFAGIILQMIPFRKIERAKTYKELIAQFKDLEANDSL